MSGDAVEIWFYHLERSAAEDVLPPLLQRTLQRGWRALVRAPDAARLQRLDAALWSSRPDIVVPHGLATEPHADRQPVLLTTSDDNANSSQALFLLDGAEATDLTDIVRVFDLFDGHDEIAVTAARGRWKRLRGAGAQLSYWTQTEMGRWEKRE